MRKRIFLLGVMFLIGIIAIQNISAEEYNDIETNTSYIDPIDETGASETLGDSWITTITIDSGTNFDIYAWWKQDITGVYNWNPEHKPVSEIKSVTVKVRAWDVDNTNGIPPPTSYETDLVYLNNQYLGVLKGSSNGWSTSVFSLTKAQIDAIFGSLPYPLALTAFINVDSQHSYNYWAVTVDKVIITIEYESEAVKPDLTISEIKPVQVVYHPDINGNGIDDMVQGKQMAVLVDVGIENPEAIADSTVVTLKLSYEGMDYFETLAAGELKAGGTVNFYLTPNLEGTRGVTVAADPYNVIEEENESNNNGDYWIEVKDTKPLNIAYIPITYLGPLSRYQETVEKSGEFIKATYPVADGEFENQKLDDEYQGCSLSTQPILGAVVDSARLFTQGKVLLPFADQVIGVAPSEYFDFQFGEPSAGGVSYAKLGWLDWFVNIKGVFIQDGYWTAAAHEIGHMYGLPIDTGWCFSWESGPHKCEEYEIYGQGGRSANGFWVEKRLPLKEQVCFMGTQTEKNSWFDQNNKQRWVGIQDYEHLFKKLKTFPADPQLLIVNGVIYKNGTVQTMEWYKLHNGTISDIISGNYSIKVLNDKGGLLAQTFFDAKFPIVNGIEMDFTGFAFAIPYPENTFTIQITQEGVVLKEIIPTTKLLYDAIESIPDYGFINNPEQRRNALHNKINAVEKMLEQKNKIGAKNKLEKDIKDKIEKWLIEYEKENPFQFSKDELIALINDLIAGV